MSAQRRVCGKLGNLFGGGMRVREQVFILPFIVSFLCVLLSRGEAADVQWSRTELSSAPAAGGSFLPIRGEGFQQSGADFYCLLKNGANRAESQIADVEQNDLIVCILPAWPFPAAPASLIVVRDGIGPVPFAGSDHQQTQFVYIEGWQYADQSNPAAIPASGGTSLALIGYGLDSTVFDYTCMFSRGTEVINVTATAVNAARMTCTSPAWGSSFSGSWSGVSLASGQDADAPVSVSLFRGSVELRRTKVGTNRRLQSRPCPDEQCRVKFYAVWAAAELDGRSTQLQSAKEGGGSILLSGFGFDVAQQYFCAFDDGNGNIVTSSPSLATNTTNIHCVVPAWPFPAANCSIALHVLHTNGIQDSLQLGPVSASALFSLTFLPEFHAFTPTSGLAKGGTPLLITGDGFDTSNQSTYHCAFTQPAVGQIISPAVAWNQTAVTCEAGRWPWPAATAGVSLLVGGALTVELGPESGDQFEFIEGWDARAGGVTSGPASGGSELVFMGHGFGGVYECVFGGRISVQASALNSTVIACVTPAWGAQYSAGSVVVTLQRVDGGVTSQVPFLDGGDAAVNATRGSCALDTCLFEFDPVWTGIGVTAGSALGGFDVPVWGYGFAANASLFVCRWTAGNLSQDSPPVTALNETVVFCRVPEWVSPAAVAHVTLLNVSRVVTAGATASFEFQSLWVSKNVSSGPAVGGFGMQVEGIGFDEGDEFACVFAAAGYAVRSNAMALDTRAIVCGVPAWPTAAQVTTFSVLRNGSDVVQFGGSGSEGLFKFTAGVYGLDNQSATEGPSSGGERLIITGFGFDVNGTYNCTFFREDGAVVQEAVSVAHVHTTAQLSCVTPSWGSDYAAAPTAVGVTDRNGVLLPLTAPAPSLATLNALECFANSIPPARCSFTFTTLWTNNLTAPNDFTAAGGEVITLRGFGFKAGNYTCRFEQTGYDVSSVGTTVSPQEVRCLAPVWRYQAVADAVLSLLRGGAPVAQSTPSIQKLFSIAPIVIAISPTFGAATGGDTIVVSGNGFNPALSYTCALQGVVFGATYLSDRELQCTVPTRTWGFEGSRMVAAEEGVQLRVQSNLTFEFVALAISASQHFGNRLGGVGTVSSGGSHVTITGAGFFAAYTLACSFTLVTDKTALPTTTVSASDLQEKIQSMREILDTTDENSCQCPGGCKTFTHGSISDGFGPGGYRRLTSCYWLLAPRNASSLSLSFSEFDTERDFDLVTVWSCDDEACTTPTLLNVLSGSGPPGGSHIVSPTGIVLVTFKSDQLLDGQQGFTASFEPAAAVSSFSASISPETFVCTLPVWDADTPWQAFSSKETHLRVLLSEDGGLTSTVVQPSNGDPDRVLSNFTFVQINRRPSFDGYNVDVLASLSDRHVRISDWAGTISVGLDDNGAEIQAETDQLLAFSVTSTPQDLFSVIPFVSLDGTLSFTVAAEKFGVSTVVVTLSDDGGTSDGGVSGVSKTFRIEVLVGSSLVDNPQFSSVMEISVAENSGPHIVVDAIFDVEPGRIDTLARAVNVSVSTDYDFFMSPPFLEKGTLHFQVLPFVFGNATINVTAVAYDQDENNTRSSTGQIRIAILPVNSPPSFEMQNTMLVLDESQNGTTPYTYSLFASAITTGPNISAGPNGEDWPETSQTVTFDVVGGGSIFAVQPTIASNGTLTFTLASGIYGQATLVVHIRDSGGVELGGIDMSDSRSFAVVVNQINDQPSFDVNCDPVFAIAQSFACGPTCERTSIGCEVDINVDENCVNCLENPIAECDYGLVVESFAVNIRTSVLGSPQEVTQNLSFVLTASNDSLRLLETAATFSTETGTLVLCLKESANGNATFRFELKDDGGTYGSGNDTAGPLDVHLQVYPVNQQPSFEICSDCLDECCDMIAECCGSSLVVWEASGFYSMPDFVNGRHRGWLDAEGNDPESFQSFTFTVTPLNTSIDVFARVPFVHENGTLDFEFVSNVSGVFDFEILVEDDGYEDDVASGTVSRNVAQGTAYAGQNTSRTSMMTMVVSNSFVVVCYNASLADIHAHASALEQSELWNSSILGVRHTVADGLGINIGRILLEYSPSGFCLRLLADSVQQALEFAREGEVSITQFVQAGLQDAATARRALLSTTPDLQIAFVSAAAFKRDHDHVPTFDVVNETHTTYQRSNPFVLPIICGYPHDISSPFVYRDFVSNIESPSNSPMDDQGNVLVTFDIVPIRHRLRDTMPWTEDGTDGGLFTLGPLVVTNCPDSCNGSSASHPGCQLLPSCLDGALVAVQNEEVHGEAEYEMTLRGSNKTSHFRMTAHRLLQFRVRDQVIELNESLVNVSLDLSDFFFVQSQPGDGGYQMVNFAIECVDCSTLTHQRSSLFAVQPVIVATADNGGDLFFTQRGGMFGNATLRASISTLDPDVCEIDLASRNVSVGVMPVNNAPFFQFNCSVDPAQVQCPQPCDEPANNCSATVLVEENCRYCSRDEATTCDNAFSLRFFVDPTSLAPSRQQYLAESEQNMTFSVIPVASTGAFAGDVFSELPRIDAETGTLSFCLRAGMHGNVTFDVQLRDDGGDDRGGEDLVGTATLTVVVFPVNDIPSFRMCAGCAGSCCDRIGRCCGPHVTVWESDGFHRLPTFVDALFGGNASYPAGFDESHQRTTFSVETPAGSSALFTRLPYIYNNGTLDFEFVTNVSGLFVFDVYVEDDGDADDIAAGTLANNMAQGTAYAGVNRSLLLPLTLLVSNSYALIEFNASTPAKLTNASLNETNVTATSANVTTNATNGTETPAAFNHSLPVFDGSLLRARIAISEGLGINIGRVLVHQRRFGGFVLQIVGSSVDETVGHVRNASAITEWVRASSPRYNASFVSAMGYMKDLEHVASYTVDNTTLTSFAMEHPPHAPWVLERYISNIVSPPDSPLDDDGRRLVFFDITPLVHRSVITSGWTADGTDGGLTSLSPMLSAVCQVEGDEPCFANLSLWKDALSHGQAVFQIKMRNSALVLETNLTLTFVFSHLRAVEVYENQVDVLFPRFVRSIIDPDVPYRPLTEFDFIPSGPFEDADFGLQSVFDKQTTSDVNFSVAVAGPSLYPVAGTPRVELQGSGFGELSFGLLRYGNGNTTFRLAFSDSWYGGDGTFVVVVRSVNQPPRFDVQPLISVIQHRYSEVPYVNAGFAFNILTSPAGAQWDERNQSLSFTVLGLDGNQTRTTDDNSTYPMFTLWPTVAPNGTIVFRLRDDWFGRESFRLVLRDDGGTERGGDDDSFSDFEIEVLHTNHAPTFDLAVSSITVLENSGMYRQDLSAQNLSTGAASGPELEQELSFLLVERFCNLTVNASLYDLFALQPALFVNGTVVFEPERDMFGSCTFEVFLFDDGGTERNGTNFSVASLQIVVELVNTAPTFDLLDSTIVRDEEQDSTVFVIPGFASNIIAGPPSEEYQRFTFQPVVVDSQLPYDSNSEVRPDAVNSLYLFNPSNPLRVFSNGTLVFELAPFRNGRVTLALFLIDDGGTRFNGSNVSVVNFTVEVLPVNSVPSLSLSSPVVFVNEGVSGCSADPFVVDVHKGGWAEFDQLVHFEFVQTSGPYGVVASMYVQCAANESSGCSHAISPKCVDGKAYLWLELTEHRFGNLTFNMTMTDDGGRLRGGVDSVTLAVALHVVPVNSQPSFRLSRSTIGLEMGSERFMESFAFAITLGSWEDARLEGCSVQDLCAGGNCLTCENQTGAFSLTKVYENASAPSIFLQEPNISYPGGTLSFKLNPDVVGIARFEVVLVDSGALDGTEGRSAVAILEIISQPILTFELCSPVLEVFEGSGAVSKQVVFETREESVAFMRLPSLSYHIAVDSPHLFDANGQPWLSPDGVLSFTVNEQFGTANITVWLRDDGGTENGRRNLSEPQYLTVRILAVNDPPSFAITPFINVSESASDDAQHVEVPSFATAISPGPRNEGCEAAMRACEPQNMTFVIVGINGISLFQSAPRISANGTLELDLRTGISGSAQVSVQLIDDGYSLSLSVNQTDMCGPLVRQFPSDLGRNTSQVHIFVVFVHAVNTAPSFEFPWRVRCDLSVLTPGCACATRVVSGGECVPHGSALIETRESVGRKEVTNFATSISPARGFYPKSMSSFAYDPVLGQLGFDQVRGDPIAQNQGFEYAGEYVLSPDNQFVFAVEYETDSLAVFSLDRNGPEVSTQFVDRRTEKQNRLLVVGFPEGEEAGNPNPTAWEPRPIDSDLVCDWTTFEVDGHQLVGAAAGCEDLESVARTRVDELCGPHGLGDSCDRECCEQIVNATRGHWEMETKAMTGDQLVNAFSGQQTVTCSAESCEYFRPQFACGETYPTTVVPATIGDKVSNLGAAVLTGPNCKNFFNADWDGPLTSLETFMINDGTHEAMQFDGILHTGMYITDDIRSMVDKFPSDRMSAEVWFTIEADDVSYGGLIAVQQDGTGCRRGWSLAYDVESSPLGSLATFYVSVATADDMGTDEGQMTVVTHSEMLQVGHWYHMVGVYNGSNVYLYLDGVQRSVQRACGSWDCGPIIYAESYSELGTCIVFGAQLGTPFTIGTYENRMNGGKFPHVGSIKTVRILDIALADSQVFALYNTSVDSLLDAPTLQEEYWVQAKGNDETLNLAGPNSPNHDFAESRNNSYVALVGNFSQCRNYFCRFTYSDPLGKVYSVDSDAGNLTCSLQFCGVLFADTLACKLPQWFYGFKATVMSVHSIQRANLTNTTTGVLVNTTGLGNETALVEASPSCLGSHLTNIEISMRERGPVWQRACLTAQCGFTSFGERRGGVNYWFLFGGSYALHPQLKGSLTHFRFVDPSALYVFEGLSETLHSLPSLAFTPCAEGSCLWDKNTCQDGPKQGFGCANSDFCGSGFVCSSSTPKDVMGARSFTHVVSGGRDFLLVARGWEGLTGRTESYVFSMLLTESNQTTFGVGSCTPGSCGGGPGNGSVPTPPPIEVALVLEQAVTTAGAGNWEHSVFDDGREFVAVSQLLGLSSIYVWDPSSTVPISVSDRLNFHPAGASKIDVFTLDHRTYLVAATFQSEEPSSVYEVQSLGAFRQLDVTRVLDIPTPGGVYDVQHARLNETNVIVFAIAASDRPSLVYKCEHTASVLDCAYHQSLDTTAARSIQTFKAGSDYLLVAQEIGSTMLRWNGTRFLGEITADTLPSDTAAGLELPNIARTLRYYGPVVNGTVRDYFFAGRYVEEGDEGEFAIESYWWTGFREVVTGMDGPLSVQVSPVDGRFIYVASELSQVISIYALRNRTGTIQYLEDQVFVRGLQQIAISPDQQHMYATVYVPGAVVAFHIDPVTGRLSEFQRIENSADWESGSGFVEGLRGATGLHVSLDGASVYVAAYIENAMVTFNRNVSGLLTYSDRIINGERSIFSFHNAINEPSRLNSPQSDISLFPRRLPLVTDVEGFAPARGSVAFKLSGVLHVAVAFSDEEPGHSDGTALVYRWSEASSAFDVLQATARDTSASCVEHIPFVTDAGDHQDYLLVGNAYHGSGGGSGISVYEWGTGSFSLNHVVGANQTEFPLGLYASSMQHFIMGGVHYLAVSCYRDEVSLNTKSYLFRARTLRSDDTDSNARQEIRFDVVQSFDTQGATDVVYREVDGNRDQVLLLANYGDGSSAVRCYRFERDSQVFAWSQTIPAAGVYDLEAFHLPDVGDMLAVANRQVEPAFTIGDLPNYDAESQLFLYNARSHQWQLFQSLGGSFQTLMEESSIEIAQGDYEGVYTQYFCRPRCVENQSPQGVKLALPWLRGVTAFTAFHSEGETYLAVAQSVCDRDVGVQRCASTMPQPQSAILQFNKQSRRFGEMLAGRWSGDRKELRRLERALRIDAGRTTRFTFIEQDDIKMLLACSLSSGAVVYEWDFAVVTGLAGAMSVTADAADDRVLIVSREDRSVTLLQRDVYVDDLGLKPPTCADDRCLRISQVLSETPKRVSRLHPALLVRDQGLRSASKITFWEGENCAEGEACMVKVTGRQPRDELQCLGYPPMRDDPIVTESIHRDAECQNVEFRVSWVSDDNPDLFVGMPTLSPDGTLTFEPRVAQQGTATFSAFLLDDRGGMSDARQFTIAVLEVNRAPQFQTVDGVANAGAGVQSVQFALDVSAGQEEDQELVWSFTYTSEISIGDDVEMQVVDTPEGKIGVVLVNPPAGISGVANFSVVLSDFGPSDFERGDVNRSLPQTFTITVRRANLPPVLELPSSITVVENSGLDIRPDFVSVVSLGSQEEFGQSVTLSVFSVEPDAAFFERLLVHADGTLEFEVRENQNGKVNVTVRAQDNGGTELNGVDTSFALFLVDVLPRNSPPAFIAPTELVAISSVSEQSVVTLEGFLQRRSPPADEASQNVTVSITSISNQGLFSQLPTLDRSGTLSFALIPHQVGESLVTVTAVDDGGIEQGGQDTATQTTVLEIVSGLRDPDFHIPSLLDYVEAGGPATIATYVSENGAAPSENFNRVSFAVNVQTSNARLFVELPQIAPDGALTFTAHGEEFGQADLTVTAFFDRRLLNDNISGVLTLPPAIVRVLPRPRVFSISPNVGTGLGGTRVTIHGDHMGSQATKQNVTVTIGGEVCGSLDWVSRVQLSCVSPPGLGPADVVVAVGQGLSYRSGRLVNAFTHAVLYYGGTDIAADQGYLAAAPSTVDIAQTIASSLWPSSLELTATVSAIESWAGQVIVASSYEGLGSSAIRAGNVIRWDGESASPLANGLDGPVTTLADYQGMLVVGGVFTAAHQQRGRGSLRSGGMVGWDGERWSLVGDAWLQGSLSATLVSGTDLYVAGAFQRIGGVACEGLARYNGSGWSCPWGKIEGGAIREIVMWRGSLVIGGSFKSVGGVRAGQLARWEAGRWIPMGAGLSGVVHCLARQEDRIYVGGEFSLGDSRKPVNLAYYSSAKLHVVGEGFDRGVYALTLAHNCLYVGGAFHHYAVRFCVSDAELTATRETVLMGDGSPLPGPIRVIAHAVGREQGETSIHTINFASTDYDDEVIKEEL